MPIPEHIQAFPPARAFREGDLTTLYWIQGKTILYNNFPLRGADIGSFSFYQGGFAKDHKHCYCTCSRLTGGNSSTFRALNYAYATDGIAVWTIGGKIEGVDAESFAVCDDGIYPLIGGGFSPHGFGKDKNRVYYYDYVGKPNQVRKAAPASFISLNDGNYGKDDNFVFCSTATLPKANVAQWQKISGYYSKDDARIYYANRLIPDADHDTFEVMDGGDTRPLARDKNRFYMNDRIITEVELSAELEKISQRNPEKIWQALAIIPDKKLDAYKACAKINNCNLLAAKSMVDKYLDGIANT